MTPHQLRKELHRYSLRLDSKGFVANHDGNLSARMPGEADRFLATPTARAKFDLSPSDLIVIDSAGKTRSGTGRIFSEWAFHRSIYGADASIRAVVHAHPPFASALGLNGVSISTKSWPEAVVSLGAKVSCVAAPALSDDDACLDRLALAVRTGSACLMEGNGAFGWGSTLEQAYLRLELVEHLAHIFTLAQSMGPLRDLPESVVNSLIQKRKKAGLSAREELPNV